MYFELSISCDNAAFEDDPNTEVARILEDAARRLRAGRDSLKLMDINGNHVGDAKYDVDKE